MTLITSLFFLTIGTVLLYIGAEWIVKSGVHIASKFNIPSFIIGLTVVAFGTSLPELVVSLKAALSGSSTIAIGNVVGSNVANVGLVLGLSSLVFPITMHFESIRRDIFIYLFVCLIFVLFILDGYLVRWEGCILLTGIVIYTWMCIKHPHINTGKVIDQVKSLAGTFLLLLTGIVALYFGSDLFVSGAIALARLFGVREVVIGMSVVAFGTSLPELATSVVAAFRKESAISVGNIIGSNIFNLLSVIGLISIIKPLESPREILSFEIPFMVVYGLVVIPLGFMKQPISRISSIFLISGYIFFIFYLFRV